MLGWIGPTELLVIAGLIIVIFGPKKMPEVIRSLGKGYREVQKTKKEIKDSLQIVDLKKKD